MVCLWTFVTWTDTRSRLLLGSEWALGGSRPWDVMSCSSPFPVTWCDSNLPYSRPLPIPTTFSPICLAQLSYQSALHNKRIKTFIVGLKSNWLWLVCGVAASFVISIQTRTSLRHVHLITLASCCAACKAQTYYFKGITAKFLLLLHVSSSTLTD
jgi:hypothetical protein